MSSLPLPTQEGPDLPLAVSSVHIRGLHGKFNYDVDLLGLSDEQDALDAPFLTVQKDRLALLYGRNGSGKTSLLQLLFHAISPSDNSGHRTALAKTRFRNFEVKLTDRSVISYARPDDQPTIGGCVASVLRPGQQPVVWKMMMDEEGRVMGVSQQMHLISESNLLLQMQQPPPDEAFLAALAHLNLNPVLLTDSRRITSDVLPDQDDEPPRRARRRNEELARARDVEMAIERARRYLVQVAFAGTQLGSSRVDSVYQRVAEAISKQTANAEPSADVLPSLISRVETIAHQAEVLNSYGLMPEFDGEKLTSQLRGAPEQYAHLLHQVLDPYLEGLEQRIEALGPGLTAVSTYLDALNDFLEGKRAEFLLGPDGIVITDEVTNERLRPEALSSGEKQIVLLFSDIVSLQNETRLFIIDEPELSLNPEWQRHLMPRLLGVTEQSRMQLIAATHSIEIMAQFRDRIRHLSE